MEINKIIEANKSIGGHFFDEATMDAFNSRILEQTFPAVSHVYFVTSEQYESEPRHFKVRVFSINSKRVWTPSPGTRFFSETDALNHAEVLKQKEIFE
jgi:hypothetical protein